LAFTDPFPGLKTPLKNGDLVRALRLDLAAEEDAIHLYTAHADATDNILVRALLVDISNEERIHAGELLHIIDALNEDEQDFILKGYSEVDKKYPRLKYHISGKE